jgi:hypothetical protein
MDEMLFSIREKAMESQTRTVPQKHRRSFIRDSNVRNSVGKKPGDVEPNDRCANLACITA